ncbi:hypothetical protein NMG60_11007382 [Bertholletia excelsa]
MSFTSHCLLPNSNSRVSLCLTCTHVSSVKLSNPPLSFPSTHFSTLPYFRVLRTNSLNARNFKSFSTRCWPSRAFEFDETASKADSGKDIKLDFFLSIAEFLCLASSAVICIVYAMNSAIPITQKPFVSWLGNKVFVWQFILLVGAAASGASIRRRQWRRICTGVSNQGNSGVNLIDRVEKLEEEIRSLGTVTKVLSRQLEKLGIRFRVTRKSLIEPISETAALAQKNSEATRVLAAQEDILEKELAEIQKVLLAMQEQQQKQLELILAIGKSGKLWNTKQGPSQDQEASETCKSDRGAKQMETPKIQALAGQKESNNDRA